MPRPSYTIDTLDLLRERYPDYQSVVGNVLINTGGQEIAHVASPLYGRAYECARQVHHRSFHYLEPVDMAGLHRESRDFCPAMLRYLPRIYITAFDLRPYDNDSSGADNGAISDYLEEPQYDSLREVLAATLGEHEMYLDASSRETRRGR